MITLKTYMPPESSTILRSGEADDVAIDAGSWVIDTATGAASCSAEGYRILGLAGKTASAHYMECLANVHPDDLGAVLRGFQESVASGEPRPLQYRIVGAGGAITDVETIAEPQRDETGRVVRVVGTVMDVTERNRIRNALRAQVNALTKTLDALVTEASPDHLPEVVIRSIAEQFGVYSMTVWLTDKAKGRAGFAYQFLDDRLLGVNDAPHPAARMSLEDQDNAVWRQILASHQYDICPDVEASRTVPFREYNLAMGVVTILVVPMLIAGETAGMLGMLFRESRSFRPDDIELAQALANHAMLAIQLTRLSEQSRQSAVIAERNRIARDVHDTLAQTFTGVIVQLEAAEDASQRGLATEEAAHRTRASDLARTGLQEARRSVMALRPQALENQDLATALHDLITRMTAGTSLVAELTRRGAPRPLPWGWDVHLLHIGQEALTNALRHAKAHRLSMRLLFGPDDVRLEVSDDGRGFDPTAATSGTAGAGLAGMRARVASMGGRITIDSATGAGTTVAVVLPSPPV